MTKLHFAIPALLVGVSLSPVMAQEVADADGNGTYSLEELMVAYPSLTAEVYATIDSNTDGAVDATELQAAVDAGTLTTD